MITLLLFPFLSKWVRFWVFHSGYPRSDDGFLLALPPRGIATSYPGVSVWVTLRFFCFPRSVRREREHVPRRRGILHVRIWVLCWIVILLYCSYCHVPICWFLRRNTKVDYLYNLPFCLARFLILLTLLRLVEMSRNEESCCVSTEFCGGSGSLAFTGPPTLTWERSLQHRGVFPHLPRCLHLRPSGR